MSIPVYWATFCENNPARGRWDQAFLERLLDGSEWRDPASPGFHHVTEPFIGAGIVVFPCGHYVGVDCCDPFEVWGRLAEQLEDMHGSILIATSDEHSFFPWDGVTLPDGISLWAQSMRPENAYPPHTEFFPLGSPIPPAEFAAAALPNWEKPIDVFLAAQDTHDRRTACFDAMDGLPSELTVESHRTPGFTEGLERDEYVAKTVQARIVPCPSGVVSQETFRMYEALEAGCAVIRDRFRPDQGGDGFWRFGPLQRRYSVADWRTELEPLVEMGLESTDLGLNELSEWQWAKRHYAERLGDVGPEVSRPTGANDAITVVIPTSVIPSHPDTSVIEETIQSVRDRLPTVSILILCDGVRNEQWNRAADFDEYTRRLLCRTMSDPTIQTVRFSLHHHQSGMFRFALDHAIRTPYVMFVEHDTPLLGDVDYDDVLDWMALDEIASMRFHHDVEIHETSHRLYLDIEGEEDRPYLRTVQWSQRPHIANTGWYRDIMATYFGRHARTMIEDVMHGVVQHGHVGGRSLVGKGWQKWRMAVWAPPGDSIKFSGHLDARGEDPKFPMFISYDQGRPEGAPPEGNM